MLSRRVAWEQREKLTRGTYRKKSRVVYGTPVGRKGIMAYIAVPATKAINRVFLMEFILSLTIPQKVIAIMATVDDIALIAPTLAADMPLLCK